MKAEIIFIEKYSIILHNKSGDKLAATNEAQITIPKSELEQYRCHFAQMNNVLPDEIRFVYKSN